MKSNAYNIRTTYGIRQKDLEKTHNVDMIEEDVNFHEDNCHGRYIARCKPTVCKKWQKNQNRKEKRRISLEKKLQTSAGISEMRDQVEEYKEDKDTSDKYVPAEPCEDGPERKKTCTRNQDVKANENEAIFPKVKIQESFTQINEKVYCS